MATLDNGIPYYIDLSNATDIELVIAGSYEVGNSVEALGKAMAEASRRAEEFAQEYQRRQRPKMKPFTHGYDSTKLRIGRNDPCPCGSGKKAKHCHRRSQ